MERLNIRFVMEILYILMQNEIRHIEEYESMMKSLYVLKFLL